MVQCSAYVGLDVNKDTIAVAVALPGLEGLQCRGQIKTGRASRISLIQRLSPNREMLSFCYEDGPCGYGLWRAIIETGHQCEVVAPSLVPSKRSDRVSTDRRGAVSLARQHRSGELTAVWVPVPEQEVMRDLTRAREDVKAIEMKERGRLAAFLLRHSRVCREGRRRWTGRYFRWLETQTFECPAQQGEFEEYVDTLKEAQPRVGGLEEQMRAVLPGWSLCTVVEALRALWGVELITAMTILAELGDLTRFDSPRQLMSFLGLLPSEQSSGARRRQGGMNKMGNGHVLSTDKKN